MARPNGQIRRGQIINVFGPGALMDLPHHAAIVGGLDGCADDQQQGDRPRGSAAGPVCHVHGDVLRFEER